MTRRRPQDAPARTRGGPAPRPGAVERPVGPVPPGAAAAVTVPSARRFARRQRSRRLLRWRPVLLLVLVALAVGTAGWAVAFSDLLDVRTVSVRGLDTLTEQEVTDVTAVPAGLPLVRVDTAAVERRVAALPVVKDVDVRRRWPHTLVVAIRERSPVAVVRDGLRFRLLDRDGVAYRALTRLPAGLPVVQVPTGDSRTRRAAATVAAGLPDDLRRLVVLVRAETPDSLTLELSDGREVRWGGAAESDSKARVLSLLLERSGRPGEDVEVFDVSVPERPTTRT